MQSIKKMINKLPAESSIYKDSAYLDYGLKDTIFERRYVLLKIQRKSNSKKTASLE